VSIYTSNTTDATSGAWTIYPSGVPEFIYIWIKVSQNTSNTKGVSSGAGTVYPSGARVYHTCRKKVSLYTSNTTGATSGARTVYIPVYNCWDTTLVLVIQWNESQPTAVLAIDMLSAYTCYINKDFLHWNFIYCSVYTRFRFIRDSV